MASSARIDELRKKFDENPRRYFAPLANEYRKAGDLEQAIFICQEYLPQQPGHMSGHIVYGQALFELNRLEESRQVFETALSLDPENLIALRHLGDIARQTGDSRAARGWYQRVLEADPRNEEIAQIMMTLLSTPIGSQPGIDTGAAPAAMIDVALSVERDEGTRVTDPVGFTPSETGFAVEKSEDRSGLAVGPELTALPERQPTPAEIPAVPPPPAWTSKIPDDELLDLNDFSVGGVPLTELGLTPSIDQPPVPETNNEEPSRLFAESSTNSEESVAPEPEMVAAPASDDAPDVDTSDLPFEADPFAIAAAPRPSEEPREEEISVASFEATVAADSQYDRMPGLETFEHGVAPPEQEPESLEFEAFFMPTSDVSHVSPTESAPSEPAIVAEEPTEPEPVVEASAPEIEPWVDLTVPSLEPEASALEIEAVIDIGVPEIERASDAIDSDIERAAEIFEMPVIEPVADVFEIPAVEPIADVFGMPTEEPVAAVFEVPVVEPLTEVFEIAAVEPIAEAFDASADELSVIDLTPPVSYDAIESDAAPAVVAEMEPAPEPAVSAWDASFEIPAQSEPEAVPASQEAFVTETMAELYLQQGHSDAALEIYQRLVEQRPDELELRDRLRVIEEHVHRRATPLIAAAAFEAPLVEAPAPAAAGPTIREFLASLVVSRAAPAYADDGYAATPVGSPVAVAPELEPASIEEEFGEPFVPSATPTHTPVHDALAIPVVDAAIDAIVDFGDMPLVESSPTSEPAAEKAPEPSPAMSRRTPAAAGETVRGSIDALFSGAGASSNDATAASTLAQAYAPEAPETTPLRGVPAHKAASELSLDHVFKTGPAPRSEAENDGFSFDQFFADDLAEGATQSGNTPPANPRQGADDIEQFNNWLNGLKKT